MVTFVVFSWLLTLAVGQESCSHNVVFTGCSEFFSKPTRYNHINRIQIQARPVAFSECQLMKTITSYWRVNNSNRELEISTESKRNSLNITPFYFEERGYGLRTVKYTFKGMGLVEGVMRYFWAFATCYFTIFESMVDVRIAEGHEAKYPCGRRFQMGLIINNRNRKNLSDMSAWRFTCAGGNDTDCVTGTVFSREIYKREKQKYVDLEKNVHYEVNPVCDSDIKYTFGVEEPTKDGYLLKTKIYVSFFNNASHITFTCPVNCGELVNPLQPFRLQAEISNRTQDPWQWNITQSSGPFDGVFTINPPNTVTIEADVLKHNETYIFRVQKGSSGSIFKIQTARELQVGNCSAQPTAANIGDVVLVRCSGFSGAAPLLYQIFALRENSSEGGGEQGLKNYWLKSAYSEDQEWIVSSSNIMVRVRDVFGSMKDVKIAFNVPTKKIEGDIISSLLRKVKAAARSYDIAYTVEMIAAVAIASLEHNLLHNNTLSLKILKALTKLDETSDIVIRGAASSIMAIVQARAHKEMVTVGNNGDDKVVVQCGTILKTMSEIIKHYISRKHLPSLLLMWTYKYLMTALAETLKLWDPLVSSRVTTKNGVDAHQAELHKANVKKGTNHVIDSIIQVMDSMDGFSNMNNFKSGKLEIFAEADDPANTFEKAKSIEHTISFSEEFHRTMENHSKIAIKYAELPNIFWWAPHAVNTKTVLLQIKVGVEDKLEPVAYTKGPIVMALDVANFKPLNLSGTTSLASPTMSVKERDKILPVHSFKYAQPEGAFFLTYDNEAKKNRLRILVTQDVRPDYEATVKQKPLEDSDYAFYRMKPVSTSNALTEIYVSILPGPQEYLSNSVPYNIGVRHATCVSWDSTDFVTDKCQVDYHIEKFPQNQIVCNCHHVTSVYGGRMFIPPNLVSPWNELDLFTTLKDNYYVALVVGGLFLLFMLLLIISCSKCVKVRSRSDILYLEDSNPGHRMSYIIGMQSGYVLCPRVTAKVAMRIIGEEDSSQVHILNRKRTLVPGTDDWFLIFTRHHLGALIAIELWHNDEGCFPFWFCCNVVVIDLAMRKPYFFRVEQWISTETFDTMTSKVTIPVTAKRKPIRESIEYNVNAGFREGHRFLSLCGVQGRSVLTFPEKLSHIYGVIIVGMLISMMFFGVGNDGPADEPQVDVTLKTIIVAIESILLSLVLNTSVSFCFNQGRENVEGEQLSVDHTAYTYRNVIPPKHRNCCLRCLCGTKNMVKGHFAGMIFAPSSLVVAFPSNKRLPVGKIIWLVMGWTLSFTINAVSTFLVLLYGLHYKTHKSELWLLTFSFGIFEDSVIMDPGKIIIFGFIAGLVFRRSTPDRIRVDQERPDYLKGKEWMPGEQLDVRRRPEYSTLLRGNVVISKHKHARTWKYALAWSSLSVSLLLTTALVTHIYLLEIRYECYVTNLVGTIVTQDQKRESVPFAKLRNMTEYLHTLLPTLHDVDQYNGKPLPRLWSEHKFNFSTVEGKMGAKDELRGWLLGTAYRLMGVPRIKQTRLLEGSKPTVHEYFRKWFEFSNESLIFSYRQERVHKVVLDLGPNSGKSGEAVARMIVDNWVDHLTQMMKIVLGFYSENTGRFIGVILSQEKTKHGPYSDFKEIWAGHFSNVFDNSLNQALAGAAIPIIAFLFYPLCYYRVARYSLQKCLRSFGDVHEFFIALTTVGYVAYYIEKNLYYSTHHDFFDNVTQNDYFDIKEHLFLFHRTQVFDAIFVFLTVTRSGFLIYEISVSRNYIADCLKRGLVTSAIVVAIIFVYLTLSLLLYGVYWNECITNTLAHVYHPGALCEDFHISTYAVEATLLVGPIPFVSIHYIAACTMNESNWPGGRRAPISREKRLRNLENLSDLKPRLIPRLRRRKAKRIDSIK